MQIFWKVFKFKDLCTKMWLISNFPPLCPYPRPPPSALIHCPHPWSLPLALVILVLTSLAPLPLPSPLFACALSALNLSALNPSKSALSPTLPHLPSCLKVSRLKVSRLKVSCPTVYRIKVSFLKLSRLKVSCLKSWHLILSLPYLP